MILFYVLILLFIVMLSYKLTKGDYFNLTFIFLAGYLISALCCLYNSMTWAVKIQLQTVIVLLIGISFFSLGSLFGGYISFGKKCNVGEVSIYQVIAKGDSYWKLLAISLMDIIIIIFLYSDIKRIASVNMVSWGNLFYNFRANLGNEELGVGYSFFVDLGLRLTRPLAYIYMVIFCGSVFDCQNRKTKIKKAVYLFPVLLYAFQVILQGYRIQLIALIVAFFFCSFFFIQINHSWRGRINLRYIRKIVVAIAVICVGFYYVKFFIGKLQESNGVIAYVTNYLGGSLQLFDMYLLNPINGGHETFAALVNSLKNFGLFQGVSTVVQHEYRNAVTGVYIGNVYTGFRNYYNDFGMLGVIIFSGVLGTIFSYWYAELKRIKFWNVNRLFGFILYSSFLYTIVFHFFTDYFYSLIGVGWFINITIFYFLVVFIFKIHIKFS